MSKKFNKSLLAAGAMIAAVGLGSAPAQAVNIGGILINPGAEIQIGQIFENVVTGVGQTLSGYGSVSLINGSANFCAGGIGTCELTFSFTGFLVTAISPTSIAFSGGSASFYVGTGATLNFNPFTSASSAADLAAATDGLLWLTVTGHPVDALGNTLTGTGANLGTGTDTGTGTGLFDVFLAGGGAANGNFDTNSVNAAFGGPADFQFGSSFSNVFLPHPSECSTAAGPPTGASCLAGSADIRGLAVPEPASLGLLGTGLLALGLGSLVRRSRRQAS